MKRWHASSVRANSAGSATKAFQTASASWPTYSSVIMLERSAGSGGGGHATQFMVTSNLRPGGSVAILVTKRALAGVETRAARRVQGRGAQGGRPGWRRGVKKEHPGYSSRFLTIQAAPTPECKLRGALRNASHSRIENSKKLEDSLAATLRQTAATLSGASTLRRPRFTAWRYCILYARCLSLSYYSKSPLTHA